MPSTPSRRVASRLPLPPRPMREPPRSAAPYLLPCSVGPCRGFCQPRHGVAYMGSVKRLKPVTIHAATFVRSGRAVTRWRSWRSEELPHYGYRMIRLLFAKQRTPMSSDRAYRLWRFASLQEFRNGLAGAWRATTATPNASERSKPLLGHRLRLRHRRGGAR
jgi:hypothetical protein